MDIAVYKTRWETESGPRATVGQPQIQKHFNVNIPLAATCPDVKEQN